VIDTSGSSFRASYIEQTDCSALQESLDEIALTFAACFVTTPLFARSDMRMMPVLLALELLLLLLLLLDACDNKQSLQMRESAKKARVPRVCRPSARGSR